MAPSPPILARASRLPSSAACALRSCASITTVTSTSTRPSPPQPRPHNQRRAYRQAVPAEGAPIPSPTAQRPDIPPYPLGPRPLFKQANTGLYGRARLQFGNTVSEATEVINPQKNRRRWWPNIQEKRLFSEALGIPVRTRVNTRVLRTIDKVGGLDAYLLGSKPARIAELGPWGWRLRWRIMQTPTVQARFRRERVALGLPEEGLYVAQAAEAAEAAEGGSAEGEAAEVASEAGLSAEETAETQRMLDNEDVFDMAPQEGFMHERSGKKA